MSIYSWVRKENGNFLWKKEKTRERNGICGKGTGRERDREGEIDRERQRDRERGRGKKRKNNRRQD